MRAPSWRKLIGGAALATFGVFLVYGGLACGGPRYPSCDNDEQCKSDTHHGVCVNHLCNECRADDDCGQGKECKAGACAAVLGYCDDPTACAGAPCGKDHRCQKAVTSSQPPAECADDRPCAGGARCENGHCVSPPQGGPGCRDFPAPKFDYESQDLRPDARQVIERLAKCLSTGSLRGAHVLLTGHCDNRGEAEYNFTLGAQRAENVKTLLIGLGADMNKIVTSSRGELDATGTDEAGWSNDRRVDVEIR